MKTAIWLYLFLFVAFFDLHAQYPILTPFAISLGAAPSFIGLMMGMYSITHLPGNLIAGYGVDRFGSRLFIVFSLLAAGIILLFQSQVTDPWQLLVLRSISGFVLAFLSPACLALLARLSNNITEQGKLMAGNGLVHTLASVVSPAAGAYLVAKIGFTTAFTLLGWILIVTAVCAVFFISDKRMNASPLPAKTSTEEEGNKPKSAQPPLGESTPIPWLVFLLPIATSCSQGILSFELPLMAKSQASIMTTGLLFSVVSIGALITLSMLFLNRISAFQRTLWGAFLLAVIYFCLAANVSAPFTVMLLLIGMAKGIILPALSTLLIELSGGARYGRTFSILSIAFSIGAFIGPMAAGQLREQLSPYFIAFVALMLAVAVLPFYNSRFLASRTYFS
ncbi:MFS transporter [Paenibacillus harenae]|uniref:MFS family permease n=1 Tax=Paenibacillus harenae TaxID=306543 RepID=A0ABT9U7V7_PAEHA|nr:MFS transporter [Paenibacillus harenae]MDQ0060700.1 MFS family permease [Paenibacillus harenae]MDQ0115317.1 MFS family permease [Paenibacillus harenae]